MIMSDDIKNIATELTLEAIDRMKGLRADKLTETMQHSGQMMEQVKAIVERLATEYPEKDVEEIKEMASVELDNLILAKEGRGDSEPENPGNPKDEMEQ